MSPSRRSSSPAHVTTAEDLRRILRDDPEAFCGVIDGLIERSDDEVTKDFWQNVRELVKGELAK